MGSCALGEWKQLKLLNCQVVKSGTEPFCGPHPGSGELTRKGSGSGEGGQKRF